MKEETTKTIPFSWKRVLKVICLIIAGGLFLWNFFMEIDIILLLVIFLAISVVYNFVQYGELKEERKRSQEYIE